LGRPWAPFAVRPIQLFGTIKTNPDPSVLRKPYGRKVVREGNCLDPVRGCPFGNDGGCFGICYSAEAMKRYHVLFGIPVPQILRGDLLRRDLARCGESWVRVGVNGEPSCDWDLTIRVAGICREAGKDVVILTRLAVPPTEEQLRRLVGTGACLSVTVWGLDPESVWRPRLEAARRYIEVGGRAIVRLVTFAFGNQADAENQERIAQTAREIGTVLVEQPARVRRTSRYWPRLDTSAYTPYGAYTDPHIHRWFSAGRQIPNSLLCAGHCPSCTHKCGLYPENMKGGDKA
jgi:hypothetical protein